MINKDLFINKLERVEHRMKSVEVSLTRPNVTLAEIRKDFDVIREQLEDLRTMVQREK